LTMTYSLIPKVTRTIWLGARPARRHLSLARPFPAGSGGKPTEIGEALYRQPGSEDILYLDGARGGASCWRCDQAVSAAISICRRTAVPGSAASNAHSARRALRKNSLVSARTVVGRSRVALRAPQHCSIASRRPRRVRTSRQPADSAGRVPSRRVGCDGWPRSADWPRHVTPHPLRRRAEAREPN
jgi:hypothetical protein